MAVKEVRIFKRHTGPDTVQTKVIGEKNQLHSTGIIR